MVSKLQTIEQAKTFMRLQMIDVFNAGLSGDKALRYEIKTTQWLRKM